jgi:hypothetical protein
MYHWESLEELLLESVDITSTSSAVWFLVSIETLPCPPTVMWISPDGCQANWFCCDAGSSETSPLVYFKQGEQCHWHLQNLTPSLWRDNTQDMVHLIRNHPWHANVLPAICCVPAMHLGVKVELTYMYATTWTHSEYRSLLEALEWSLCMPWKHMEIQYYKCWLPGH